MHFFDRGMFHVGVVSQLQMVGLFSNGHLAVLATQGRASAGVFVRPFCHQGTVDDVAILFQDFHVVHNPTLFAQFVKSFGTEMLGVLAVATGRVVGENVPQAHFDVVGAVVVHGLLPWVDG